MQMWLRILRWGDYPGSYPGGPSVITGSLGRRRQEGKSQRRRCDNASRGHRGRPEDALQVAWEMEEGTIWKVQAAPGKVERAKKPILEPSEGA